MAALLPGVAALPLRFGLKAFVISVQAFLVVYFCWFAYNIRLYPIKDYGYIIHELDPWFNYRATEYLAENGLSRFFKWYDYMSWYPIGRPVGTTIYPGMQIIAVAIRDVMRLLGELHYALPLSAVRGVNSVLKTLHSWGLWEVPTIPKSIDVVPMSINDICCMMPAWFSVSAAFFTGLIAYEVSRSMNAFVLTVGIMAIIPAGLMRSVAGEYDNEAVAVTFIVMTFFLWLRAVRTPRSWPIGILAGLSYVGMVAVWGGYIFVLNMIGIHALMLVGLGRFNSGVFKAYTLFFVIGTFGAMQVPVVGWQPLRSLEQMGPLLVFLGFQVMGFCDAMRRARKMKAKEFVSFRIRVFSVFVVLLFAAGALLWPTGYFGPLSSRIRGLFVKHMKTGNPLVDSVSEHQPASAGMYNVYLNLPYDYAYLGLLVSLWRRTNALYFIILYGFIAYHFSGKMSRLVLICAPICSICAGLWAGFLADRIMDSVFVALGRAPACRASNEDTGKKTKADKKKKASSSASLALEEWEEEERPGGMMQLKRSLKEVLKAGVPEDYLDKIQRFRIKLDNDVGFVTVRLLCSLAVLFFIVFVSNVPAKINRFVAHCDQTARSLSNPQVIYKVQQRDGRTLLVDDYLKGYQWIDQNTPKDARVMAWWDYGYQITGIAKRTSIADGNTWNHEHIALLGRTLSSPEKKAWNTIRHLADYVLVWAGGQGDDLAKSPHLARIGNSVFPDHCGDDDPGCSKFSFYGDGQPTPMMAKSLLYKLVKNNLAPGVKVNDALFQEVHTTKYGLMRIYKVMNVSQESKDWVADPANRVCDAPGSWYCVGQYPPALTKLIEKRRNFAQVEDFNKQGAKSAYTKMIEAQRRGGKVDADL